MHILYVRERKPLNTPIVICGAISEFGFLKDFEIVRVIIGVSDSYIKKNELVVSTFEFNRVLYRWVLTVQDV